MTQSSTKKRSLFQWLKSLWQGLDLRIVLILAICFQFLDAISTIGPMGMWPKFIIETNPIWHFILDELGLAIAALIMTVVKLGVPLTAYYCRKLLRDDFVKILMVAIAAQGLACFVNNAIAFALIAREIWS